MSRCEKCFHRKVCIDSVNYKHSENCGQYVNEDDVAPVRHGRWIEQSEESLYSCSACGTEWVTIEGTPEENGMDFCPHCGANMDLKEV